MGRSGSAAWRARACRASAATGTRARPKPHLPIPSAAYPKAVPSVRRADRPGFLQPLPDKGPLHLPPDSVFDFGPSLAPFLSYGLKDGLFPATVYPKVAEACKPCRAPRFWKNSQGALTILRYRSKMTDGYFDSVILGGRWIDCWT